MHVFLARVRYVLHVMFCDRCQAVHRLGINGAVGFLCRAGQRNHRRWVLAGGTLAR